MTPQRGGPGDARDSDVTEGRCPEGRRWPGGRRAPEAGGRCCAGAGAGADAAGSARLAPARWLLGRAKMAAAGGGTTRLLLLLLMAAAAPSRARGSGCRSGPAVRGVSTRWWAREGGADGNRGSRALKSVEVGTRLRRAEREEEVKAVESKAALLSRQRPHDWDKARA